MSFDTVIPTSKRIERLQYENPWWTSGNVQQTYQDMSKRLYFDLFYPFVKETDVKRAVVLMGPRRVGKTVMMYHTIQELIKENITPKKIFFIGIDNPIYMHLSLEDILLLAKEAVQLNDLEGCFVFFDEIQYLKDWERHLKVLVDSYPKTKFVVSGSAAAALRLQSSESGAGRFTDFMLPPLTFHEYIHLKGLHHLVQPKNILYNGKEIPFFITHDNKAFNKEFFHYLNFGGYPEVVLSEKIQSDMGRYVKNDIVDKVLLRDLPSLYGIKDVQELNSFFSYLAYNTGNEFSFERLGKDSGIAKEIIKKYLEYLEAAFLIKVIHKIDDNAKKFKRVTSFKVYLTNSSLRTALFSPIVETDKETGNMVETAIFSQWMHRENLDLKYARWKMGRAEGEVDIVLLDNKLFKPQWCVEIKWSNRYVEKPQELNSLIYFCKQNNFKATLVTTIDISDNKTIEEINITYVPAAVYAYNIGVNTLEIKSNW
ncbi:ATP-binding protein [Flavobacterium sp.]|jgi:predicted AAA+ superfamily ATPase|uniref:ATP-binding protein n=1 Tax=Flavobacterium sp. TaxID=239 RepID=UPI001B76EF59|nr:ATP-binding protein [Flavobacterium sp.]MBP6183118.1 ATP-binding protein [Flavobacterium sp.]